MPRKMLLLLVLVAVVLTAGASGAGASPLRSATAVKPVLTLLSPTNRSVTNEPTVTVAGKTDAKAVWVAANDETLTPAVSEDGTFSAQVVLHAGLNVIRVTAQLGDVQTTVARSVTLDRTPPRISSLRGRRAVFSTASRSKRKIVQYRVSERVHLSITVGGRYGKKIRVFHRTGVLPNRGSAQLWNGRVGRGRMVKPGVYRMTLVARDRGGNTAARTARVRIVVRRDSRAQAILRTALSLRGVRYVWGGMSPSGFDCSGFVGYVYARHGIGLPRVSRDMVRAGRGVPLNRLKPADILLFNTSGRGISHAGLYLGGGRFINSSSGSGGVVIASLRRGSWYRSRLVAARRVLR